MRYLSHRTIGPNLVKVVVELEASDWHSFSAESLWAEDLGGRRYRLRNSPFAAYGYSLNDVVRGELSDGRIVVVGILLRGGHSTYRVILSSQVSLESPQFHRLWGPLEEIGCTYEQRDDHFLAIDVPSSTDIHQAYGMLEAGEKEGAWDFEEAHCGHAV